MRTGLSVGDVMTQQPIYVPKELVVQHCAILMREKKIGSVLVTEDDRFLGLVTSTDILDVVASGDDLKKVTVGDIMTTDVISISPKNDILKAITLMKNHDVRHLPVLSGPNLVGFLTIKDVLRVEPALFELLYDMFRLREEQRKLALVVDHEEGFCELCGNLSVRLLRSTDGRLSCFDCQD